MNFGEVIVEVNEEEDGLEWKLSSSLFISEICEITLRPLERLLERHISSLATASVTNE